MKIDWKQVYAVVWRAHSQALRPVTHLDTITLEDLYGIDRQKRELVDNSMRFLTGKPANNALLWGARGTGKSSLVKAILNEFAPEGLRLIEIPKSSLHCLPELVDVIREQPYRYIVYCDDFSFDLNDHSYVGLKSLLEGSIEAPPENVCVYATSNRRHLVPEIRRDNNDSYMEEGELHYSDAIEEKISLSDRFGLWLSFYQPDQDTYLGMVDSYFTLYRGDRDELHRQAIRFATSRASRSGRTAKQFYQYYTDQAG